MFIGKCVRSAYPNMTCVWMAVQSETMSGGV